MTTTTRTNTRTITGQLGQMLEYARWLIGREVDFSRCRYSGQFNAFLPECEPCRFGAACCWLNRQRAVPLADASPEQLIEALRGAVRYVDDNAEYRHGRHCDCETCGWRRSAKHLLRSLSDRG